MVLFVIKQGGYRNNTINIEERFSITMHLPRVVQNAWLSTFRYQEREHTAAIS